MTATLALSGCGLGAGAKPAATKLTITRDFGARPVRELDAPAVGGGETVMRVLERNAKVATRFGGGFVQSIDGLAGSAARQIDWFYYVNGVEASRGAAATRLHGGDRVWWDRHDWSAAMRVPAVVGSFPEPFAHGIDGKRLPVRVECADPGSAPCHQVSLRLASYHVPVATRRPGPGARRGDAARPGRPLGRAAPRSRGRRARARTGGQRRLRAPPRRRARDRGA